MLLALLLTFVQAEVHELEVRLSDNVGQTVSKIRLSNIKSTRAQATIELDQALNFPVRLEMPSSIHWDDKSRYCFFSRVKCLNFFSTLDTNHTFQLRYTQNQNYRF